LAEKGNWTVVKYMKDLKVSVLDYTPSRVVFSWPRWIVLVIPLFVSILLFALQKYFIYDASVLWLIPSLLIVIYRQSKKMTVSIKSSYKMHCIIAAMNKSSEIIANFITDLKIRKSYDTTNYNIEHISDETEDGESFI